MREIILERIMYYLDKNDGFSKYSMRWMYVELNGIHVSQIIFDKLSDEDLVRIYEKIIRQHNKQM